MSIYRLESFDLTNFKVLTNAVDEINDGLVFYFNQGKSRITDDGYMFNEFHTMNTTLPFKRRQKLTSSFAKFYSCKFDKKTEEIYMNLKPGDGLDEAVMAMIQTCTAISTIINYERLNK